MTVDRSPMRADPVPPVLVIPAHAEDDDKDPIGKPDSPRQLVLGFVFHAQYIARNLPAV